MIKPVARKFPLGRVPPDLEEWLAVPLEERLRAAYELALFFARMYPLDEVSDPRFPPESERIAPIARKRALGKGKGA
ncbi:MAG: hypothetical protein ACP5NF_10195 [Thermoanaerobaculum sp.]